MMRSVAALPRANHALCSVRGPVTAKNPISGRATAAPKGRRAAHGGDDVGDRVGALVLLLPIVTVKGVESGARVERRDNERPAVRSVSQPVRNAGGREHDRPFIDAPALGRYPHGGPLEILHLEQ